MPEPAGSHRIRERRRIARSGRRNKSTNCYKRVSRSKRRSDSGLLRAPTSQVATLLYRLRTRTQSLEATQMSIHPSIRHLPYVVPQPTWLRESTCDFPSHCTVRFARARDAPRESTQGGLHVDTGIGNARRRPTKALCCVCSLRDPRECSIAAAGSRRRE